MEDAVLVGERPIAGQNLKEVNTPKQVQCIVAGKQCYREG